MTASQAKIHLAAKVVTGSKCQRRAGASKRERESGLEIIPKDAPSRIPKYISAGREKNMDGMLCRAPCATKIDGARVNLVLLLSPGEKS
jgi:hypothetical protein